MISIEMKDVLNQRGKTHGDFSLNSTLSQSLKQLTRQCIKYTKLTHPQKEALDMILHKISRIVAGDSNYIDHWLDIQGYSQLVIDEIKKENNV